MNALAKTLLGTHHSPFGPQVESTAAMDLFVLLTLGFLFFLLGCFATWAWIIWRRSTRPEAHIQLLMELEEQEPRSPMRSPRVENHQETKQQQPPEEEDTSPWERPGDWWKQ